MSQIGQRPRPRLAPFETARRTVVGYANDYPSGTQTAVHAHPKAQLLYALRGVMRIEATTPAGLVTLIVPPGTGVFMPAALRHAVKMDGPVAMRALFLQTKALGPSPNHLQVITVSPLLRELILAACAEPVQWNLTGRGRHLAALSVEEIRRAPTLPLILPTPVDPRLRRLTDTLIANPTDPRTLAQHATSAAASPRTLTRLFLRETGMGFQQWRRQLRLTEAVIALAAGRTINQAAALAGYASSPAFGAAFRMAFGTSPGEMRRQ